MKHDLFNNSHTQFGAVRAGGKKLHILEANLSVVDWLTQGLIRLQLKVSLSLVLSFYGLVLSWLALRRALGDRLVR